MIAEVAGLATSLVSRTGYDILGHPELRAVIAERYTGQGIPTRPEQIMVTNGAQHALNLIAGTLLRRADRVLIETPTYPHAMETFRRAGSRLVGVPVDVEHGWDLDRAAQAFARTTPVLAYLMPEFQNPTGRTMTAGGLRGDRPCRARCRIRAADRRDDRRTAHRRTAHRGAAARCGRVDPVGSLGKSVWGGLRIGWIRADADLIRRLRAARASHDLGTPDLEQAIAARVVARLDEILPQRSALLRAGRDALVDALADAVPDWSVPDVHGGVALWVGLGAPLSSALVIDAAHHGLHLSAGPRFAVEGGHERRLRIPFTAEPRELERAVEILAASWRRVSAGVDVPASGPRPTPAEALV